MTSASEPERRFRRAVALQASGCWALAVLAAAWAWRAPAPVVPAPPDIAPAGRAATAAPDPAAWRVELWRPVGDEVPAAAAPAALRLFSVLRQEGGLTAALAAGDSPDLIYVRAGDICRGGTVVRVDPDAVILRRDGREQRLELGR